MEAMPYTQSLLANGVAMGYHAKAAPPTVTMPRLKAMVSGAIGGFLHVALNFNTQAMVDDRIFMSTSYITGQFFRIGWKMVLHGDERWLKLFPGLFMRHDGVVVSDHGMTQSGNHGGSSYEETDSLALFIGQKNDVSGYRSSTHEIVHQVDIAPTLALLLGVPIPKNNVGLLIPETFRHLTDDQQLKALKLNSWQLLRLLQAQLPSLSCQNHPMDGSGGDQESRITECSGSIERMFCCLYANTVLHQKSWMSKEVSRSTGRKHYSSTVAAYYDFLRAASEWLSR